MKTQIIIAAIFLAAVATLGIAALTPSIAQASQTCVNGGGNTPSGNCNGEGLTVINPAGHAPPGQQP